MLHNSGKIKRILDDKSKNIEVMMVIARTMAKEKNEEALRLLESQYEFFEEMNKEKDEMVLKLKNTEPKEIKFTRIEPKIYETGGEFKNKVKYKQTQFPKGIDDLL